MKSRKLIFSLMILALVILVLTACDVLETAEYVLNIYETGEGGYLVSPKAGAYIYEYGKEIPIEVHLDDGYEVVWEGPDGDKVEKVSETNYKVRIIGNMEIHAVFTEKSTGDDAVAFYDFEDGKSEGWSGRGTSTVNVVDYKAHKGTRSLLSSGRTESWNGPELNLKDKIKNDNTYYIEIWVYHESGNDENIQVTFDLKNEIYLVVAQKSVPSGEWTLLKNDKFSFETEDGGKYEFSDIGLYIEASNNDTLEFFIDDVLVKEN